MARAPGFPKRTPAVPMAPQGRMAAAPKAAALPKIRGPQAAPPFPPQGAPGLTGYGLQIPQKPPAGPKPAKRMTPRKAGPKIGPGGPGGY